MNDTQIVPAAIPESAHLPATYEAARQAIEQCYELDEVKNWADKAAALATYARMAKDDSLRVMATRIQERAIRRGGELLKQIKPAHGANQNIQEGALPKVTRESVAEAAGLSEHQRKVALRLASIPKEEFERAVESDSPPTLEALARWGTIPRPASAPNVQPADPLVAAQAKHMLREFSAFCANDPVRIALAPSLDADFVRGNVEMIDRWLDRLVAHLPDGQIE